MADDLNGGNCKTGQKPDRFLGSGQLRTISKRLIPLG